MFENRFFKYIMESCEDELSLDFISQFDSVIISLANQQEHAFQEDAKKNAENPALESSLPTVQEIDKRLKEEIGFFQYVIENNSHPSLNFIWTYVGKLAMVTKNLFIHKCSSRDVLFQYMLCELQKVYSTYYNSADSNILAWRVSRALDAFCDEKSDSIPDNIKAQCILKKVD